MAQLLPVVSAGLREEARKRGKNFDEMLLEDEDLETVAKSVVVDVAKRYICDNATDSPSFTQMTQSAGGYSVSGTFSIPGKGVTILNNELKRLGITRPKAGCVEL